MTDAEYAAGRLLVRFDDGISVVRRDAFLRSRGSRILRSFSTSDWHLLALDKDRDAQVDTLKSELNRLIALHGEELAWRERAQRELAPALERYEAAIRDTIGLRQQERLPRAQALYVAGCSSGHRDISLSF